MKIKGRYDVIIAGAGPAGSSAAAILGQAGKKVLLVDKKNFPRDKTCGDGLTFKCLPALERLNLLERFWESTQVFARGYSLYFSDNSEITARQPGRNGEAIVFVLPRYRFDEMLFRKAISYPSVHPFTGGKVRRLLMKGRRVHGIELDDEDKKAEIWAPLLIDATGANSGLAVQAGAGNRNPKSCALALRGYFENVDHLTDAVEFYFDKNLLPGYYWIFPTSPTAANIGCGTFQHILQEQHIDLRQKLRHFFTNHPVASQKLKHARLKGDLKGGKIPLALDYRTTRVRPGFIMTGDAAAFTDPITAEGISYALHSGIIAGETAIEALDQNDFSEQSLKKFDTEWKRIFNERFSHAPLLTEITSQDTFREYLVRSFSKNAHAQKALGNPAMQYELMFKLKSLMKAI